MANPVNLDDTLRGLVNYRSPRGVIQLQQQVPNYEPVGNGLQDPQKRAAYNTFITTMKSSLEGNAATDRLSPLCPHSVIQVFVAQHNAIVNAKPGNVGNDEPLRTRNAWCWTIGFAFTLVARIIRVVVRTLLLIPSLALSAYQQSCYSRYMNGQAGNHHIVKEDLQRYAYEWIDLAAVIGTFFAAFVNTFAPMAIPLDRLRNYYIDRVNDTRQKNAAFDRASNAYNQAKAQLRQEAEAAVPAQHNDALPPAANPPPPAQPQAAAAANAAAAEGVPQPQQQPPQQQAA